MAEIVLVHGIGQEHRTADSLEADWLPALAGSVRKAGFAEVADKLWHRAQTPDGIATRMAFYGHHFRVPDQQGDSPVDPEIENNPLYQELAIEWLKHAAERSTDPSTTISASREMAFITHTLGEEQGLRNGARCAVAGLANVPWFANLAMFLAERYVRQSLAQVTRYFVDPVMRAAAIDSVMALVGPETKVLIGHSLGSVVAYEAAHNWRQRLPLLVTLGSPLGLHTIIYQRLVPRPPCYPLPVQRWVNVADLNDVIAVEPDLRELFSAGLPADSIFESRFTVDNGDGPHRADFYLGTDAVGTSVGKVFDSKA